MFGRPLQVRHFTFSWNCDSSVARQCTRAILSPLVHTGSQEAFCSDLTSSNNLICTLTSLVQVKSSQSWQIRWNCGWINDNRPQSISWGSQNLSDYVNYFHCPTNRPTIMLLIVLISQSSSANLKWSLSLILFCSFPERRPLERHIFLLLRFLKTFSWAKICVFMWPTVKDQTIEAVFSIVIHQIRIWIIRVDGPTLSAELFFFLINLFSWIITRKELVHPHS